MSSNTPPPGLGTGPVVGRGDAGGADAGAGDPSVPTFQEWALYLWHSVLRHRGLVVLVFVAGMVATGIFFATRTPLYRVETRLLAQRQQSLPSIARAAFPDEAATRTAYELVHRRENLEGLLKETGILPLKSVPARTGWKATWRRLFAGRSTPSDPEDEAINTLILELDKQLVVTTGDGTLTISLDWPDPQEGYHLVQAALQSFLEARQIHEITAIDDAIALLRERVATARAQLDKVTAQANNRSPVRVADPSAGAAPLTPPPPGTVSQDLQRLAASLEARERSLRDVEDMRHRRQVELQGQLEEKRGVYSDSHPTVIALRKEVDAMNRESPQLISLREEVRLLREEYAERLAAETKNLPPAARPQATRVVRAPAGANGVEDQQVRDARLQYEQMVERLNAAQSELDAARAAFKYRYSITWPARAPKDPVSPNPVKYFGAGFLASLALALGLAVGPDLLQGRVRERWQVERTLGLPVLGELVRR